MSKACDLRAELEEISDDCHNEWCAADCAGDEAFWYEQEQITLQLADMAGEIENYLTD